MLCPFCVGQIIPQSHEVMRGPIAAKVATCPQCKQVVPTMYQRDYRRYPPVVLSTVGFSGHGKTVFLGSVFYSLVHRLLGEIWPEFHWLAVNETSLERVMAIVDTLRAGGLPEATKQVFPTPTLVRLAGAPHHPDCTLLWYDAAGESFESARQLVEYASFVRHSRCLMFLVSLPKCYQNPRGPAVEMLHLLNTYVLGRADLGGRAREQELIVTFTMGDDLLDLLPDWSGGFEPEDDYHPVSHHLRELQSTSAFLRRFVEDELRAHDFLRLADESFRSVEFSVVSALGAPPAGDRQSQMIHPWRVLDPVLWTIVKSTPVLRQWMHRVLTGVGR